MSVFCRVLLLVGVLAVETLAAEYHVTPGGSASGDGSAERPWDLQTALSGGPSQGDSTTVRPGDVIWIHGGTYRGGFKCQVAGNATAQVTIRAFPGERATIDCRPRDARDDGLFDVRGDYCVIRGLEFTCSDPKRETTISGSWPEDIRRGGIFSRASHVRFINLVIHDLANGIGFWSQGEGGEVYGCLISHNGWKGPDRGHGHAIYAQNESGTKRIEDNILFNQFGSGIHCYGSEKAALNDFHIEGNVSFNNGCLTKPEERTSALLLGGGTPVRRGTVVGNFTYGGSSRFGYSLSTTNEDLKLVGNYFVGNVSVCNFANVTARQNTVVQPNGLVHLQQSPENDLALWTWDENTYYRTGTAYADFELQIGPRSRGHTEDEWRRNTGLDRHSQFHRGRPTQTRVFVRPNRYEPGRGHLVIYNWETSKTVDVDLSGVLQAGQKFRIVSAQNFYGLALVTGMFRGDPVRIPMQPVAPAAPVGMSDFPLPITEPEFGVFVVLAEK